MNRFIITHTIAIPSKRLRLRLAFLVFVLITFILLIFQPFGTYDFHDTNKYGKLLGYGLIGFIGFSIVPASLVKYVFHKEFQTGNWDIRKEVLILTITFILVNSTSALYFYFVISAKAGMAAPLLQFQLWGFLILIFPISGYLYFLFISNRQLKLQKQNESATFLTVAGNGKTEMLTIDKNETLYFKASDNYVEIYLQKKLGIQKHIIRASLSSVYAQIKEAGFVQVHRSYLVNIFCGPELVAEKGNYEIYLAERKIKIPVSRTYLKEFRKKLNETPL